MSDDDVANITSPASRPPDQDAESGGAFAVANRGDVLRPTRVPDVVLTTDPARPDVVTAEFWNGDHGSHGATAQVVENDSEVKVDVFVGVLPEAEGRPAPAIAELQRLDIPLAAPLAGRRLRAG